MNSLPGLPDFHRRRLHDPVGIFPLHPLLCQCQQNRLREDQPVRPVQVRNHVVRIDEQPVDHIRHQREHVVQQDAAVGDHDPLDGRVRDVPLMPESDVLHRRERVPPEHAGEPGNPLARDRIALVRHRRRTLLPLGEVLLRLQHFGLLEVPDLRGELLQRAADHREDGHELGMAVALQDLGRDRRRREPELRADILLHLRAEMFERPDRPRNLPDGDPFHRRRQPVDIPPRLVVPERQLQSERRRLGVNSVRPADHDAWS